jgi:hypothetical protein
MRHLLVDMTVSLNSFRQATKNKLQPSTSQQNDAYSKPGKFIVIVPTKDQVGFLNSTQCNLQDS